jgi:hypothetical protein
MLGMLGDVEERVSDAELVMTAEWVALGVLIALPIFAYLVGKWRGPRFSLVTAILLLVAASGALGAAYLLRDTDPESILLAGMGAVTCLAGISGPAFTRSISASVFISALVTIITIPAVIYFTFAFACVWFGQCL